MDRKIGLLVSLISLFLLSTSGLFAQGKMLTNADLLDDDDIKFREHFIGASASMFSGHGLSYRYHSPNGWAIKATFFGYYYEEDYDDYTDEEFWLNGGLEFQVDINKTKKSRLYGLVGLNYLYDENADSYGDQSNYTYIDRSFGVGPGIGFEFYLSSNFSMNADVGFAYKVDRNTDYSPYYQDQSYKRNITGFTVAGGIGFGYRF